MIIELLAFLESVRAFFAKGGPVLPYIALIIFVMWALIFERLGYFWFGGRKRDVQLAMDIWERRAERKSWGAHKVRLKLISEVGLKINQNLGFIKVLIAVSPLFGLLGTVTGMIEVFQVLGFTGGGDARSMAGGVSRATIPTMAGMVAAISGVFGISVVSSIASRENQLLEDHLTMDH